MSPDYHDKVDEAQDEGLTVEHIKKQIVHQISFIRFYLGQEPEYLILSIKPYRKLKRYSVANNTLFEVGYGGPDTYYGLPIAELMETEEEIIRVTVKRGE